MISYNIIIFVLVSFTFIVFYIAFLFLNILKCIVSWFVSIGLCIQYIVQNVMILLIKFHQNLDLWEDPNYTPLGNTTSQPIQSAIYFLFL